MWSDNHILQRDNRGSRWRGWYTAWRGVDSSSHFNQFSVMPRDPDCVRIVFEDELGPITKKQWQIKRPHLWHIKNLSIGDFHVDHKQKHIWMDAITYVWWMDWLPIPKQVPQDNRWLYLMGRLNHRFHRFFLYQQCRHNNWPITWSCVSTSDADFQSVQTYYKKFRNNWSKSLPHKIIDIHPTTYNPNASLDWGNPNHPNPTQMTPRFRATEEKHEAWPSYRLHIVAETSTDPIEYPSGHGAFITEKTFRALAHGKPSVWLGSPGTIKYLNSQGYKTWGDLFDESYDNEFDIGARFRKLCQTLEEIDSWSEDHWHSVWPSVVSIAEHNQKNFIKHHRRSHQNILKAKKIIFGI